MKTQLFRLHPARLAALTLTLALALPGCGDDDVDPTPDARVPDSSTASPDSSLATPDASVLTPDATVVTPDAAAPLLDTDLVAVRFDANGSLDTTFGSAGVARHSLSTVITGGARDALWGLARDSSNRLLLFGSRRGADTRLDADRAVVRLTASGGLDTSFATGGVHTLNIANLGDNARNGFVQADGKIVTSGYTAQPSGVGTQSINKVVLLRLNDDGTPDTTFGAGGIVNSMPLVPADPINTPWGVAEAYVAARQTGRYVTAGYGRSASTGTVNMVSFGYTPAGRLDTSWGIQGVIELDVAGGDDRARNAIVLPDDRVLILGSVVPSTGNVDAAAFMYTASGQLDTSFNGTGYKTYGFGRPDEAWFGAALSPDGLRVAAVGYRAGMEGGAAADDDATLLIWPVGTGTEFAQAVPLSDTANDRFWGVTFDAAGKIYAAGYLEEGTDRRMVVVRFNPDGTRDTSFGTGGLATHNVIARGTLEEARGVAIQSDGKVVIAGVAETP